MELNRSDYALLKVLKKKNSVSFFKGMTVNELVDVLGGSRVTVYKKMNRLVEHGYVGNGCKDIISNTYFITEKGLGIIEIEDGGEENAER